jgi:hypothetical protein
MTLETTTISGLPNAATPLTGAERIVMDQAGATVDATTQDIANLASAAALPPGGNPGDILTKNGYTNGTANWAGTLDGGTFF